MLPAYSWRAAQEVPRESGSWKRWICSRKRNSQFPNYMYTSYKSDFSITPRDCLEIRGTTTTGAEGLGPWAWPALTDNVKLIKSSNVPTAELWMSNSLTSKQHMINDCSHCGRFDTG